MGFFGGEGLSYICGEMFLLLSSPPPAMSTAAGFEVSLSPPTWVAGTHVFESLLLLFLGHFTGSWITGRAAGTQMTPIWDAIIAGGSLNGYTPFLATHPPPRSGVLQMLPFANLSLEIKNGLSWNRLSYHL